MSVLHNQEKKNARWRCFVSSDQEKTLSNHLIIAFLLVFQEHMMKAAEVQSMFKVFELRPETGTVGKEF